MNITKMQLLGNSFLACLMLVVVSAPQVISVATASADNLDRKLRNTAVKPSALPNTKNDPRVVNNPNALFQPKVSIIPSGQSTTSPNTVAQQNQFLPQTSPPPAPEERRATPPVPQDPRSVPPITSPVQPQFPGRVPGVVPPYRRLNTPPVGDIAVSTFPYSPDQVDLGTNERIGRLILQGAPAVAVLSSFARSAGLSVYPIPGEALNTPINLDVENQTVQDVFNDVLRIARLQASRIGNRIFIGASLPLDLQNVVVRSLRLNQVPVAAAVAFLTGLGASTTPQPQAGILGGLQVVSEERGNSITLIGPKNLVSFAEAQLSRLDIRRRQVAVNVRVLEIRLDRGQTFGNRFTVSLSDQQVSGIRVAPAPGAPAATLGINAAGPFNPFLVIQVAQESGNLKTLTDPTLIIQEGETGVVSLEEQVVSRLRTTIQTSTPPVTTTEAEFARVGLNLEVRVARIDDNGFVTFSVNPRVAAPLAPLIGPGGQLIATPISERTLTSGQIRVRDNQTLLLTGVIRDEDRNTVEKVPFLGDIPILGALFRLERNTNVRSEVVIMVTPRIIDDSQNANWGYTYQPSPDTQRVIDNNQITLPQNQDNRLDRQP